MDTFYTIRTVIGILIFISLGVNFFYQGIKALIELRKNNYSEETTHHFKCRNCEEVYEMNGEEFQARTSIWSAKLNSRTPRSQTHAIRFACPVCQEKAFQEKIYETDVTALLGNIRAQFDGDSNKIIKDLLLKGF